MSYKALKYLLKELDENIKLATRFSASHHQRRWTPSLTVPFSESNDWEGLSSTFWTTHHNCYHPETSFPTERGFFRYSPHTYYNPNPRRFCLELENLHDNAVELSCSYASATYSLSVSTWSTVVGYQHQKVIYDSAVDQFVSKYGSFVNGFSSEVIPIGRAHFESYVAMWLDPWACHSEPVLEASLKLLRDLRKKLSFVGKVRQLPAYKCTIPYCNRLGAKNDVFRKKWFFVIFARLGDDYELDRIDGKSGLFSCEMARNGRVCNARSITNEIKERVREAS